MMRLDAEGSREGRDFEWVYGDTQDVNIDGWWGDEGFSRLLREHWANSFVRTHAE